MPEPAGEMAGVFDLELNEAQADLEDISDEEAIEIADDQLEVMSMPLVLTRVCAAQPRLRLPGPRA